MAATSTIALIAVVASTAYQYKESKKQQELQEQTAAENERQAALAQRRADYKAIRSQREQIRSARVQRAQVVNKAAQEGTQWSTGVEGATASLETQLASNLGYLETERQYGRDIFASTATQLDIQNRIGRSQVRQGAARGVSAAAGGIFSATGGYASLFKTDEIDT